MRSHGKIIPIRKPTADRGFSLLELMVVVIIIILIAGFVTPYLLDSLENAKIQRILETHSRVANAVAEFRADLIAANPDLSLEDPTLLPVEEVTSNRHQLYYDTGQKGWAGPYINHPLGDQDNPFGGATRVANSLDILWEMDPLWQPLGESGPKLGGVGSYINFTLVPQSIAKKIDDIVDRDITDAFGYKGSQAQNWNLIGRCRWSASGNGWSEILFLFITDVNGKEN